jgi:hypothetical protein
MGCHRGPCVCLGSTSTQPEVRARPGTLCAAVLLNRHWVIRRTLSCLLARVLSNVTKAVPTPWHTHCTACSSGSAAIASPRTVCRYSPRGTAARFDARPGARQNALAPTSTAWITGSGPGHMGNSLAVFATGPNRTAVGVVPARLATRISTPCARTTEAREEPEPVTLLRQDRGEKPGNQGARRCSRRRPLSAPHVCSSRMVPPTL